MATRRRSSTSVPTSSTAPVAKARRHGCTSLPLPDTYRGRFKRDDPRAGEKYAEFARQVRNPSAFIAESVPSVGGQIVLPAGYLANVYAHVRAAGGVCIADEVQTGFGRIGTHFYAFEAQRRRARHRRAGEADRQRLSARRGRDDAARSPRRSTTAWSSSAPSAATPWRAPPAWPCSTSSRRSGCRSMRGRRRDAVGRAARAGRPHPLDWRRARLGLFLGVELVDGSRHSRAGDGPGGGRRQPDARARDPARHRRPVRTTSSRSGRRCRSRARTPRFWRRRWKRFSPSDFDRRPGL